MQTEYKAVLFDIGNVVIRIHFKHCFAAWAKAAGLSADEVESKYCFDEMYSAHEIAKINGTEYHRHICSLIGCELSYADFANGWNSIFGEVIPETQALIAELAGRFKIYAYTNSNILHREHWSVLYKNAFKDFDRIFCSSQIQFRKPGHEGFQLICRETGIPKEQFVFVDDLAENIAGAERFGMKSVLFSDPVASTNKVRALLFP